MKSIEEARRQLASGDIQYRRAHRKRDKKWDDYTVATQKKKHQVFIDAVDAALCDPAYKTSRDIHWLHSVQTNLHAAEWRYLFEGDDEGNRYYKEKISEFSRFLSTLHLTYPLSESHLRRSNAWKKVRAQVAEEDKERERLKLIKNYGLDESLTYTKARNAAKKAEAELEKQAKEAEAEANRARLGINDDADLELAIKLEQRAMLAMKNAEKGYLYFKCWVLPDDSKWYKIGITNNPSRRESEQNVLPVPAHTLHLIALESTDHARLAEAAFHGVLDHLQIKGAGNKELFHLKPKQVQAVIAAMKQLERKSFDVNS